MKLPNAREARIDRDKILGYLLSPTHPRARAKAAFFSGFAFREERWQDLTDSLRKHALSHGVATELETPFGRKYTVEGAMETPDKRNPLVRSVWIIEKGTEFPRLVTAYPLRKRT